MAKNNARQADFSASRGGRAPAGWSQPNRAPISLLLKQGVARAESPTKSD
jgi:hypothetical protein